MSLDRTCSNCGAALPDDAPDSALCPACTQSAGAQTRIMRAPSLETIGDYEVVDKLGQGGMGTVYRARQMSLGRLVALKVLPHQFGDDAEFIGRFQREAKVAATLNHANLVRVYAAGQADGCHYIAMELIEGENLHQRMKRERLSIPEALRICADVARGLQYGWERAQLVHRDIKPSNVYLSHGGEVKVGDLGLAKSLTGNTTGLTQSGTMMGTPHYMSPEQIRGDRSLDFRADVYSLGCTLYELLTGQPPYPGSDPISIARAHLDAPLPAILRALPGCPMPLVRLVGRMLRKTPRERHGTYEDLIAEMDWVREQIEGGGASTAVAPRAAAPTATSPSPTPRTPTTAAPAKAKPNVMLYAGIAAGVIIVAALAWWLVPSKPKKSTRVASATKAAPSAPPTQPVPTADGPWIDGLAEWWSRPTNAASGALVREAGGSRRTEVSMSSIRIGEGANLGRDVAVRVTAKVRADQGWYVGLRGKGLQNYTAQLGARGQINVNANGEKRSIKEFTLPTGFAITQSHTLELRIEGNLLTAKLDGTEVARVEDSTLSEAGISFVAAPPGMLIEKIEYQDLTKTEKAPAPAKPSAEEPWIDALAILWKRWEERGSQEVRREPEGMRILESTYAPKIGDSRDAAVRATVRGDTAEYWKIYLRYRIVPGQPRSLYKVSLFPDGRGELAVEQKSEGTILQKFRLAPGSTFAERHTVEMRMQGDLLTCVLDGVEVARVRDSTFTERGEVILHAGAGALIEKAELLNLDAPGGAAKPPGPPPGARPASATEPWQDMLTDPAKLTLSGAVERTTDGLRFTAVGNAVLSGPPTRRDGAVRIRTVAGGLRPTLRVRSSSAGGYHLSVSSSLNRVALMRYDAAPNSNTTLQVFPLRAPLQPGQDYELELHIAGPTLSAKLNGELLGAVTDSTLAVGQYAVAVTDATGAPSIVKSLEFLDLSGPNANANASAAELWQDVLRDPVQLSFGNHAERTPEGLRFNKPGSAVLPQSRGPRRDGAVRIRATFAGLRTGLILRSSPQGVYQLCVSGGGTKINLDLWDQVAKQAKALKVFTPSEPLKVGQEYELEMRIVGQELTAKFNGEVLGSVTDASFAEGQFGIGTSDFESNPGQTLVKSVEILDLDVPTGDGPWTEFIAPLLAKGQMQTWWMQVGNGLQVSLVQGVILDRTHYENVAVRATVRSEGDAAVWWIMLRLSPAGRYGVKFERGGRGRIFLRDGSKERELAVFDLPAGFSMAENHTIEFRAQGDRFSVAMKGRELAVVYDRTNTSGIFEIMGTPGTIFEKVELRELLPPPASPVVPAPPASSSPKPRASAPPATEPWTDALAKYWTGGEGQSGKLLRQEAEGGRVLESSNAPRFAVLRDAAVRATVRNDTAKSWHIYLRYKFTTGSPRSLYKASILPDRFEVAAEASGKVTLLHRQKPPAGFDIAGRHTMEFRVQGDLVTCALDGTELCNVRDSSWTEAGVVHIHAAEGALIEKVELLDLTP